MPALALCISSLQRCLSLRILQDLGLGIGRPLPKRQFLNLGAIIEGYQSLHPLQGCG